MVFLHGNRNPKTKWKAKKGREKTWVQYEDTFLGFPKRFWLVLAPLHFPYLKALVCHQFVCILSIWHLLAFLCSPFPINLTHLLNSHICLIMAMMILLLHKYPLITQYVGPGAVYLEKKGKNTTPGSSPSSALEITDWDTLFNNTTGNRLKAGRLGAVDRT